MYKLFLVAVLALAACSQQKDDQAQQKAPAPAAPSAPAPPAAPAAPAGMGTAKVSKPALMIPMPKDPAQLKRLVAMGYTPHEDHLHAPGVTSCPKMSENPIQ